MNEPRTFLDGRVVLHAGDCRLVLKTLADNSVDSVVTDPPYGLQFMGHEWDKLWRNKTDADKEYIACTPSTLNRWARKLPNYSSSNPKQMQEWHKAWAREVIRVLKPGGYIMAFSGCRTYHRMACAIEDAGFITHPFFAWATGQGFPKAHSLIKQLRGNICDCERAETIPECDMRFVRNADVSAAMSFENSSDEVLFDGMSEPDLQSDWTAASKHDDVWGKEPSLEGGCDVSEPSRELCKREICSMPEGIHANGESGRLRDGASASHGEMVSESIDKSRMCSSRGPRSVEQCEREFDTVAGQSEPQERGAWPICDRCGKPIIDADGWFYGSQSLKPAVEPIYFGQKPFERGLNGAQNVMKWGTGAINVAACKIPSGDKTKFPSGIVSDTESIFGNGAGLYSHRARPSDCDPSSRWPANLMHDGSEEVLACFPETGVSNGGHGEGSQDFTSKNGIYGKFGQQQRANAGGLGDSGSAARFFASFPQEENESVKRIWYGSKADADDRLGSKHPTVKPLALIQYLVRLITPPGGVCLDLFAGTGTTGEAAFREGFRAILIEREDEYIKDIERRMSLVMEGPVTRGVAGMKARGRPRDDGPLFGDKKADAEYPHASLEWFNRHEAAFNLTNATFGGETIEQVAAKLEERRQ